MRQKQHGNNNIAKMPLNFTFRNAEGNDTTLTIETEGLVDTLQMQIGFMPRMITIDRDEKMSDAIADYELWLNSPGNVVFKETNADVNILTAGSDSSLVRVEHHFVTPDYFINPPEGIQLSDYHYWSVDGIFSDGFEASGSFKYDGSNSNSTGYLDNNLITGIEDSLVLYFRLGAGHEWLEAINYTIEYGNSHTNKLGSVTVSPLKIGEYALGYKGIGSGIIAGAYNHSPILKVYPNPSKHICNIEFKLDGNEPALVNVTDINGNLVYNTLVYPQQTLVKWDVSSLAAGIYIVSLCRNEVVLGSEKVVIGK